MQVIVGDSQGKVHSLKLSPNLRKRSKEEEVSISEEEGPEELRRLQVVKLGRILAQVVQRDPVEEEEGENEQ